MEFKTCEEYVLSKLDELENELDEKEEQILNLEVQILETTSKLRQFETIKKVIKTEGEHDGNRYALYLWAHDPGYTEIKAILDEGKEEEIKTNNYEEEIKEN